jgi:hypothetical protein
MTKLFSESGDINVVLKKEESVSVKLDVYKVKQYFIIIEPRESGNDFSAYMSPRYGGNDEHHNGIRLKSSDELRELYELLGSILLDHDYEMEQKLMNIGKEPF